MKIRDALLIMRNLFFLHYSSFFFIQRTTTAPNNAIVEPRLNVEPKQPVGAGAEPVSELVGLSVEESDVAGCTGVLVTV
jgi:hypothetical protein